MHRRQVVCNVIVLPFCSLVVARVLPSMPVMSRRQVARAVGALLLGLPDARPPANPCLGRIGQLNPSVCMHVRKLGAPPLSAVAPVGPVFGDRVPAHGWQGSLSVGPACCYC